MKNKTALEFAERLISSYRDFANKRYTKLGEKKFESIYGKWDVQNFYDFRNLFFNLITGEENFDRFYDRFDAPALPRGTKPIAWTTSFIPDLIDYEIWNTNAKLEDRVKNIEKLYGQCVKLEKEFKKKKKK